MKGGRGARLLGRGGANHRAGMLDKPERPVFFGLPGLPVGLAVKGDRARCEKATARFTSCRLWLRSSDCTVSGCGGEDGPARSGGSHDLP